MDAAKTIFEQCRQIRDHWRETWWSMAEGSKIEYDRIKKTDTLEFWKIFDLWNIKTQREKEILEAQQNKNRHGRK